MKEKIVAYILIILIFSNNSGSAQAYNSGITVNMKGYVINLGGKFFFQPCEDSTKDIWHCLDNRSFSLWYFREDLHLESIENIGDSLLVRVHDNIENKTYTSTMIFFFCSLEVDIMILDTARFEIFKTPMYRLSYSNKEYLLEGFRVDNRIKKILPENLKYLRLLYNYYLNKGYVIPKWLDEYISSKLSVQPQSFLSSKPSVQL